MRKKGTKYKVYSAEFKIMAVEEMICALYFPVVGCVVISFDVKAWLRYFRGKRIIAEGTFGIADFISFFRSNYYIKHTEHGPPRRMKLFGVEFSFVGERGNIIKQRTPAFLNARETDALRRLSTFKIKHKNGTAVIVHDLKRAISELNIEEIPQLN